MWQATRRDVRTHDKGPSDTQTVTHTHTDTPTHTHTTGVNWVETAELARVWGNYGFLDVSWFFLDYRHYRTVSTSCNRFVKLIGYKTCASHLRSKSWNLWYRFFFFFGLVISSSILYSTLTCHVLLSTSSVSAHLFLFHGPAFVSFCKFLKPSFLFFCTG